MPGRGAIVHLDGAPACRPPLLVCAFLSCRLWRPKEFLAWAVPDFPCLFDHLAVLYLWPGLCWPKGSTVEGPLPPSTFLHPPHTCSPPPARLDRRPSPLPVPGGGIVLFPPRPLCFRLVVPVFSAVSWCHLKLNSYWCSFCVVPWGLGSSTPWRSLVQALNPTLLVHAGVVRLPRTPPPSPSSPSPPCCHSPIPVGRSSVGHSARM